MGTDCILLSDFINISGCRRGIDLGCASGAIMLLLLTRSEKLHMTGLELLREATDIAGLNMSENELSSRSDIICGDIRSCRTLFPTGAFDLVAANPPYFPAGSGITSPIPGKASARTELTCTLEDICAAAAYLLRTGGTFALVHKPERLSEVFCCMSRHGIEPKRLRTVCHSAGLAPNLVLIEGRRGGKPGLKIEPSLIIRNTDGTETEEIRKIYHR